MRSLARMPAGQRKRFIVFARKEKSMTRKKTAAAILVLGTVLSSAIGIGIAAGQSGGQDKYALQIPGGLAFADIKGYEDWQGVGPGPAHAPNTTPGGVANTP